MRAILASAAVAVAAAQTGPFTTFGTGVSQGRITQAETAFFNYTLSAGATHGVITHWWITGGAPVDDATIRFYFDGEAEASIVLQPFLACGVGFDDVAAPWSTRWMGKGSRYGGWFNNFRLPFQKSVIVTYQQAPGKADDTIYIIVRGAENLPIEIGGIRVPSTARMQLQIVNATFQPLDFVDVVNVPSAPTGGLFFMHTLAFNAVLTNLNNLEGCYHAFIPATQSWPGIILSTGTEDYYDSAYYFAAGQFHGENAGFTHLNSSSAGLEFSAYRFHESDPIGFGAGGIKIQWRNGDITDPATGLKCTLQSGGRTVGNPSAALVTTYSWVYVW